jgi:hypothetical protein
MQIKKSNVNDNEIENQEELLLTLDVISPRWAKKLEESKLFPLVSIRRLQVYLELKDTSKCVVGEAYGFSSSYVYDCKRCSIIALFIAVILSNLWNTNVNMVKFDI